MIRNVKSVLGYIYYIICISGTIAMTSYCLLQYLQNEDVSVVNFNTFNAEKDFVYPAITLCFKTNFIERALHDSTVGIKEDDYINFLNGEHWQDDMLNIDFDRVTTKIEDYLLGAYMSTYFNRKEGWSEYIYNPENIDLYLYPTYASWESYWDKFLPEFHISYRGTYETCFSVEVPNSLNGKIERFELLFDGSIFPNGIRPDEDSFGILFHYHNQFFTSPAKKYLWKTRHNYNRYTMQFKIQNIVVSNIRNKRGNPCNEDWKNDDHIKMTKLMNEVGCRPQHWKKEIHLSNCTTKEQMEKFAWLDLDKYPAPCRSIQKVIYNYEELNYIGLNWMDFTVNKNKTYFRVSTIFGDSTFMEIKHVRTFDIQSLVGNAGGYLGLFTGYALIQLPNLITHFIQHIWNLCCQPNKRELHHELNTC